MEWQPIDEAPKFADPVLVWHGNKAVEAVFVMPSTEQHGMCWCTFDHDEWGLWNYRINPQPKWYLPIEPPT